MGRLRALTALVVFGLGPLAAACDPPSPAPFRYDTTGCASPPNPLTGAVSVSPRPARHGGTVTLHLTGLSIPRAPTGFPARETGYLLPLPGAVAEVTGVAGARGFRVDDRVLWFWYRDTEPSTPVSADVTVRLVDGSGPATVTWPAPSDVHVFSVSPSTGAPYVFRCSIDPAGPPLVTFPVE